MVDQISSFVAVLGPIAWNFWNSSRKLTRSFNQTYNTNQPPKISSHPSHATCKSWRLDIPSHLRTPSWSVSVVIIITVQRLILIPLLLFGQPTDPDRCMEYFSRQLESWTQAVTLEMWRGELLKLQPRALKRFCCIQIDYDIYGKRTSLVCTQAHGRTSTQWCFLFDIIIIYVFWGGDGGGLCLGARLEIHKLAKVNCSGSFRFLSFVINGWLIVWLWARRAEEQIVCGLGQTLLKVMTGTRALDFDNKGSSLLRDVTVFTPIPRLNTWSRPVS